MGGDTLRDGLVLCCAERAGRLDVAWGELAARRAVRGAFEPQHLCALQQAARIAARAQSPRNGDDLMVRPGL
eukprot:gene35030-16845_t